MDATCNGFTSQKCPRKLCAAHCRSAGFCSVHKKPIQPMGPSAATAHLHSSVVAPGIPASQSQNALFQDLSSSDDNALAAGIQMSPSRDVSSGLAPVRARAPVHTHQMSRMWSQKEVELDDEELARKERERKKGQAHLESKQNLDVVFYDQVCL